MIKRVCRYIREHNMMEAGDRILVGVSGGADSTCLLCMLRELAPELGISLEALHIHHRIRGEAADADAAFVRELCGRLQIPFYQETIDVPALAREKRLSLETAGRQARYEAFEDWRRKQDADRIAVAHQKDDNVETVLMRLFRGSGLEGLCGILPVRGRIVRPLLCVSRAELEDWLEERKQPWREDATNREEEALRNRLRNRVLPYLREKVNAGVDENVLRAAGILCDANRYMNRAARMGLKRCAGFREGEMRFAAAAVKEEDAEILPYMLRQAVEECKGDAEDLSYRHIRSIQSLFEDGKERRIDLPGKLTAFREGGDVVIRVREEEKKETEPLLSLQMRVFPYDSDKKIPQKRYTKWFDYDKIQRCVTIRHRREGDYLSIGPAGNKKLRRYFIDNKIPKAERERCTLAADGSHILWIVGYRISEAYKVTEETKLVLEISVPGKKEPGITEDKEDGREDPGIGAGRGGRSEDS
ncbi:MAG: tRNA lysidine(34) synthetase TilS [Lachnospiraceae bacterium]|nr:tRNA lysidine(34) synthetase TilS [Lachnospiraceae bacterium]